MPKKKKVFFYEKHNFYIKNHNFLDQNHQKPYFPIKKITFLYQKPPKNTIFLSKTPQNHHFYIKNHHFYIKNLQKPPFSYKKPPKNPIFPIKTPRIRLQSALKKLKTAPQAISKTEKRAPSAKIFRITAAFPNAIAVRMGFGPSPGRHFANLNESEGSFVKKIAHGGHNGVKMSDGFAVFRTVL
jgi:hypothetical protein